MSNTGHANPKSFKEDIQNAIIAHFGPGGYGPDYYRQSTLTLLQEAMDLESASSAEFNDRVIALAAEKRHKGADAKVIIDAWNRISSA